MDRVMVQVLNGCKGQRIGRPSPGGMCTGAGPHQPARVCGVWAAGLLRGCGRSGLRTGGTGVQVDG